MQAGLAAERLHAFIEADEHYARALEVLGDLDAGTSPTGPRPTSELDLVDL